MGTYTTKKYLYLPSLGASGQAELDLYNAGQQVVDTQLPIFPQAYATGTGTSGDPWAGDCLDDAYTACPTGGTIYLRAGYYLTANTFTINKKINLIGEGINKTFIVVGGNYIGIQLNTSSDYSVLKNFTVDGAAQTPDGGAVGLNTTDASYLLLENIEAKNTGYYGINLNSPNYCTLKNIYAHDNDRHGVHAGSDTTLMNMHNTYRDIFCWDNAVSGFDDRGNLIDTSTVQKGNVFDNIQCWDNGSTGIAIGKQKGSILSNAFAWGNGGYGGILIYTVDNFNLNNCISMNNDATKDGIRLEGVSNVTLTDCQFYDDRGTRLQVYAMNLTSTNTGIRLVNCKLSPNLTGEIYGTTAGIVTSVSGVMDGTKAVAGDIMYHNGTNWVRLAKGTANQYLKMNAGATAPVWVS